MTNCILIEDMQREADDDVVDCCVDLEGNRVDIDWIDLDTLPDLLAVNA